MKNEINKMILDGEEFLLSEDKKSFKGKEKTYKIDELKKERSSKFPFSIIPPEEISEGVIYTFSSEQKFEKWLKEKNLIGEYERFKKAKKRVQKERSSEEIEKIKAHQIKEAKENSEKFQEFLKKHNLKANEIEKIQESFEKEYDPEIGESGHTLYLYDQTWWRGDHIDLSGFLLGGRVYQDFNWFNFDNKASSLSTWGSLFATVFEFPNLSGGQLLCWIALADLECIGWDNKISSCIVF